MSYLPSQKSLNYFSINWPNLLDKLMKSDINGVSSSIDEAMGIFDQMEVLSSEQPDDVVALSDNIERLHVIIEELLDLVGDAAAGKTKAQPQLQQLYQELSELEPILAYAPYAAMWIGMNLCAMQKPKKTLKLPSCYTALRSAITKAQHCLSILKILAIICS